MSSNVRTTQRTRNTAFTPCTAALLSIAGLTGCGPEAPPTYEVSVELAGQEGAVVAGTAVSGEQASFRLYLFDARGIRVSGDGPPVTLDGAPVEATWSDGVLEVEVDTPGAHLVAAGELTLKATAGLDWPAWGLPPAERAPGTPRTMHAVPGTRHPRVVTTDDSLWVWGEDPPQPVALNLGGPPIASPLADIDGDGLLDLAFGVDDEVHLLRGTVDGSFVRAHSRQVSGTALADLLLADVGGSPVPELVVAWGSGGLEMLEHTSQWAFRGLKPPALVGEPTRLAWGDSSRSGSPQLTVMTGPSSWERFQWRFERWEATGPNLNTTLPPTSRLDARFDFDGNGATEMLAIGPQSSLGREIYIIDITDETFLVAQRTPPGGYASAADGDGDGITDLWTIDDATDLRLYQESADGNTELRVGQLPEAGPMWFDEEAGDMWLAGQQTWMRISGAWSDVSGTTAWRPAGVDTTIVQTDVSDMVAITGETPTWLTLEQDSSSAQLARFRLTENNTLASLGALDLEALGWTFVACGDRTFIRTSERIEEVLTDGVLARGNRLDLSHRDVTCGLDGLIVTTAKGVSRVTFELDAGAPDGTTDLWSAAEAQDGTIQACSDEGCRATRTPDGIAILSQGTLSLGGQSWPASLIVQGDVDGDGSEDALWLHDHVLTVLRDHDERSGPLEVYRLPRRTWRSAGLAASPSSAVDFLALDDDGRVHYWTSKGPNARLRDRSHR